MSSHVRLFSISCLWDMSFSCHFSDIFMSFPWGMSEGKSSSFPSWKWCKIVQTRPSVIFSFPSTISSTWIFTNSTLIGSFLGYFWVWSDLVWVWWDWFKSGFGLVWDLFGSDLGLNASGLVELGLVGSDGVRFEPVDSGLRWSQLRSHMTVTWPQPWFSSSVSRQLWTFDR